MTIALLEYHKYCKKWSSTSIAFKNDFSMEKKA